jgi:hypothetical protein
MFTELTTKFKSGWESTKILQIGGGSSIIRGLPITTMDHAKTVTAADAIAAKLG